VIIVWEDYYSSSYNIYSQRIDPEGLIVWSSSGQAVCTEDGDQYGPVAARDDNGGVVVAWRDTRNDNSDIYTQRLDSIGVRQWPVSGVVVCDEGNSQGRPSIVGDSLGGAVIVWADWRSSLPFIYARRVNHLGTPIWTDDGNLVGNNSYLN